MMLFDSTEVKGFEPAFKSCSVKTKNKKTELHIGKIHQILTEVIPSVEKDSNIHYVSAGEWSTHNLISHILKSIGPSHLHLATWSVTPDSVSKLIGMLKSGELLSISAVFDWRIKVRNPEALQLAKNNLNTIKLNSCHAKTSVLSNENFNVSIVGSANYTNNPRIECGVITESKQIADFHKFWISECMGKGSPFE